ncbi:hypothetical protein T492DRAFT_849518 [Pavlovales sp. CCMP2436]|nr:hypothetical protein T492DRAFT_849518 [Pavlovales sp. CCMP2436]
MFHYSTPAVLPPPPQACRCDEPPPPALYPDESQYIDKHAGVTQRRAPRTLYPDESQTLAYTRDERHRDGGGRDVGLRNASGAAVDSSEYPGDEPRDSRGESQAGEGRRRPSRALYPDEGAADTGAVDTGAADTGRELGERRVSGEESGEGRRRSARAFHPEEAQSFSDELVNPAQAPRSQRLGLAAAADDLTARAEVAAAVTRGDTHTGDTITVTAAVAATAVAVETARAETREGCMRESRAVLAAYEQATKRALEGLRLQAHAEAEGVASQRAAAEVAAAQRALAEGMAQRERVSVEAAAARAEARAIGARGSGGDTGNKEPPTHTHTTDNWCSNKLAAAELELTRECKQAEVTLLAVESEFAHERKQFAHERKQAQVLHERSLPNPAEPTPCVPSVTFLKRFLNPPHHVPQTRLNPAPRVPPAEREFARVAELEFAREVRAEREAARTLGERAMKRTLEQRTLGERTLERTLEQRTMGVRAVGSRPWEAGGSTTLTQENPGNAFSKGGDQIYKIIIN